MRFHDELKWYVWRDYYVAQVHTLPEAPGKVRSVWWDGGDNWDVRLEYHETEADARAWQEAHHGDVGKYTLKQIAPHYFLTGYYW